MMKSLKYSIFEAPEREQVYLAGHCFEMLKSHPIYSEDKEVAVPTSLTVPFSSPSQNQLELTSWGMRYLHEIRNK